VPQALMIYDNGYRIHSNFPFQTIMNTRLYRLNQQAT
jgi:hypothetical protein